MFLLCSLRFRVPIQVLGEWLYVVDLKFLFRVHFNVCDYEVNVSAVFEARNECEPCFANGGIMCPTPGIVSNVEFHPSDGDYISTFSQEIYV